MWWIIGTLIGMASNIYEEKKSPQIQIDREKQICAGIRDNLIILAIVIVGLIGMAHYPPIKREVIPRYSRFVKACALLQICYKWVLLPLGKEAN